MKESFSLLPRFFLLIRPFHPLLLPLFDHSDPIRRQRCEGKRVSRGLFVSLGSELVSISSEGIVLGFGEFGVVERRSG